MKKILTLIIILLLNYTLHTITPMDKIVSISNGRMLHEYNRFSGAIHRFEDKLYVHTSHALNEFLINQDGSLAKISFYETKSSRYSYIDENRLYVLVPDSKEMVQNIIVFDISTTPMSYIIVIKLSIRTDASPSVLFNETHIMVTELHDRMIMIDKQTFEIDYYVNGLFVQCMTKSGSLLISPYRYLVEDAVDTFVTFYEIKNENSLEKELLSSLVLKNEFIYTAPKITDNKISFATSLGANIINIQEITNPVIETFIPWYEDLSDVLLYDDLVFLSIDGKLEVYQLDGFGDFTKIFEDSTIFTYYGIFNNSMYIDYPYLYMNCSYTLKVYDISNNFEIVFTYGASDPINTILSQSNDFFTYHLDMNLLVDSKETIYKYDIYSVLNETYLLTLTLENFYFLSIDIIEDILYILGCDVISNNHFFNIYHLYDNIFELTNSFSIPNTAASNFFKKENKFFFQSVQDYIDVYHLENNNFIFETRFNGKMQAAYSGYIGDVFVNFNDRTVIFRDFNYLEKELMKKPFFFNHQDATVQHLSDGYIVLTHISTQNHYVYHYDIENEIFERIYSFNNTRDFSVHNGVITTNAGSDNYVSMYYSIVDGTVTKIGEKYDNRYVRRTAFFPESYKMVQLAYSGIWVYDLEYTVSEEERIITKTDISKLHSNFPNPFNPKTTISFDVANEGNVSIQIYNLRGQKVKTLVDRYFNVGYHSVDWQGDDDMGHLVASGVYFYRMSLGDFSDIKRMVLLK